MLFKTIKESSIGKEKHHRFMGLIKGLIGLSYSKADKGQN